MKKNDIVIVTIEDMGIDGAGIGKADGYTLFIKDMGDNAVLQLTCQFLREARNAPHSVADHLYSCYD